MPRPKSAKPLEMKPIRLYKGDFERLQLLFPNLGAGPAIRKLVANLCDRIEGTRKPVDIDISEVKIEELL